MMRFVKRGADEIVHGGIHDDEFLRGALLAVQHPCQQHARRTHNRAARLDHHRQTVAPDPFPQRADEFAESPERRRPPVGDAQAAAEIDMIDRQALALQSFDQREHFAGGFEDGRVIQNLRADMAAHAGGAQIAEARARGVDSGARPRYRRRICDRAGRC